MDSDVKALTKINTALFMCKSTDDKQTFSEGKNPQFMTSILKEGGAAVTDNPIYIASGSSRVLQAFAFRYVILFPYHRFSEHSCP